MLRYYVVRYTSIIVPFFLFLPPPLCTEKGRERERESEEGGGREGREGEGPARKKREKESGR
jgi:hypothetical protein